MTKRQDSSEATLVVRLGGPLQSWGATSQFNRRETAGEPTKSGVVGLLAAAQGRRRTAPIEDLLDLRLAVRTDQPGTLLRDYHTVSDYRGRALPSASVNRKGMQRPTSPAKYTHVTQRFYLQDAVFVVGISGHVALLENLAAALTRPAFPLALGRRSCVPTQPLLIQPPADTTRSQDPALWPGGLLDVLGKVPSQAAQTRLRPGSRTEPGTADLPVIIDDPAGTDVRTDLPTSFAPTRRGFRTRQVRHTWVQAPALVAAGNQDAHDPLALLGW